MRIQTIKALAVAALVAGCASSPPPASNAPIIIDREDLSGLALTLEQYGPIATKEVRALLRDAADHLDDEEYADALVLLNKAIDMLPGMAVLHNGRASAHLGLGNDEAAIADLKRSVELEPRTIWAWSLWAQIHLNENRTDKALEIMDRAIVELPSSATLINSYAWILATTDQENLRNGVRALELSDRAIKLDRRAAYLDTRAAALVELGRSDDAAAAYLEARDAEKEYALSLDDELERLPCAQPFSRAKNPGWRRPALRACAVVGKAMFTE